MMLGKKQWLVSCWNLLPYTHGCHWWWEVWGDLFQHWTWGGQSKSLAAVCCMWWARNLMHQLSFSPLTLILTHHLSKKPSSLSNQPQQCDGCLEVTALCSALSVLLWQMGNLVIITLVWITKRDWGKEGKQRYSVHLKSLCYICIVLKYCNMSIQYRKHKRYF